MKQSYFIYKGDKYYSGTTIEINKYDPIFNKNNKINAIFSHITGDNKYVVKVNNNVFVYTENDFFKILISVINKIEAKNDTYEILNAKDKKHKFADELNIEGMPIAWIWYIFIIAIGTIFNGRIGIWIIASIIFFNYRNKKIRKAGIK
jgi:hypothetical protein